MSANLETQLWPQDWKRSVFILIPKKGSAKKCSKYWTIALISHASKVMLKILQATLPHYLNQELPDVQAGFRKGRGTRDTIANICSIAEKAREFQKNIYLLQWSRLKPLTVWVNTKPPYLSSWKICIQAKKQQLEPDTEQLTGSKLGKAVYCHPAYSTFVQSTLSQHQDQHAEYTVCQVFQDLSHSRQCLG